MTTRTASTAARLLGIVFAAGLGMAGCGDDAPSGPLAGAQTDLDAARAQWEAAGVTSYTMTYQPVCYCLPQTVTVRVEDGAIAEVTSEGADLGREPATVEDLFAEVQAAIDDDVASITAEYDPELGYPVSTWIDVDELMADEEHGVSVTSLVVGPVPAG